ncbi:MAG: glycoside hydrolase family 43 protein [Lachnospiraceae bacterium]|nr:glycoside hydrolase family 43 protein [Lachnospiraceae bacterium]
MKRKIRAILTALFLAGLMVLPVSAAEGASNTATEDGITVTITTDKAEYNAGEEIHYSITIENNKKYWNLNPVNFTYRNSDGIVPVSEDSMPTELPAIASGESYELNGILIGDSGVYSSASGISGNGAPVGIIIACIAAVLAVAAVIFIIRRKGAKGAKSALLLFLALGMLSASVPAKAAEYETITIRPYVKLQYAGEEIMIRAVIEFHAQQQVLEIEPEDRELAKKVTCHDPSIFRDTDGSYYIFGSFLAGASTQDLFDWTSIDAQFQGSFTEDVKAQIKAWNDDDSAGTWNGYLWAPDIIYNPVMEKYCMYLSANGDNWKSNIVLLTADAADGPYDYAGTIVYGGFNAEDYGETDAPQVLGESEIPERYVTNGVDNRKWGDMFPNCIDPCVFYDDDDNLWMSYGSWSGGIFMLELEEETGLRDYSVSYETDIHSDAYFGKKIAGGAYVSGEASYIQKIGDYYFLFISYGNLEAAGGYNVRVFRSETPDGGYVDELGNTPFYDRYFFNYNDGVGIRLFGGYKWRNFMTGQVAQGHNSAFVDEDGRAYIVFHTRTTKGTEEHYVKAHQLFLTKEGWLVAAPYQTNGEKLNNSGYSVSDVAGDYEVIIHDLEIDYGSLETKKPQFVTLTEDGKITGELEGSWSLEPGTPYITLKLGGKSYSGLTLSMKIENTGIETMVFTALGLDNQITVWGSKSIE